MKALLLLLCLAALLLFACPAFAADDECAISSAQSDEFFFELLVKPEGNAELKLGLKIPYSEDCFVQKDLGEALRQPVKCEEELISDALFRSLDFFIISSKCVASYDKPTGHLLIETSSLTEKIAEQKEGFWEIRFSKWALSPHKPGTVNNLRITLPTGSEIISYFPQKNSEKEENAIFWREIPEEPIGVKYTVPVPLERNPLALAVIALVIAACALVLARGLISKKTLRDRFTDLESKEVALQKEMGELQKAYLKRRVDEATFKKVSTELWLKLGKIKAEKDAFSAKEKEAGGGRQKRLGRSLGKEKDKQE